MSNYLEYRHFVLVTRLWIQIETRPIDVTGKYLFHSGHRSNKVHLTPFQP